jgi:hypothetical protein
MRTSMRFVAATQLALVFPATLFLMAVLVGAGDERQYDLAHVAQRVVLWYSVRSWTLWVLLILLPFTVLITGLATLLRIWNHDAELPHSARQSLSTMPAPFATLFVGGITLISAGILITVILHMLAN